MRKPRIAAWVFWVVLAQACGSEGGCGSDYPYPRTDPAAAPTPQALRTRLSQGALDAFLGALPASIRGSCGGADPVVDGCYLEPTDRVRFYLGSPGSPATFTTSWATGSFRSGGPYTPDNEFETSNSFLYPEVARRPYCDDTGGTVCDQLVARGKAAVCRTHGTSGCNSPGSDYCCGDVLVNFCAGDYDIPAADPASFCTSERSYLSFDVDNLLGNLHLELVPPDQGGGIRVILGCPSPDLGACTNAAEFVRGSVDFVLATTMNGSDIACSITDDPGENAGFQVVSMRFVVRPEVRLVDGRPRLYAGSESVTVETMEVDVFNVTEGTAHDDAACYDEGWTYLGEPGDAFSDCDTFCPGIPSSLMSEMLSGSVGEDLAAGIAQAFIDSLSERPLDAAGNIAVGELLPMPSLEQEPVHYLLAASDQGLGTTGTAGNVGLNLDVDVGFAADHGACVPSLPQPVWSTLPAPDPGATILAPDPVSGELRPEAFDLALIVGETVLDRAGFELFDSGSLCFAMPAARLAEMTDGRFVPRVETVAVLAPGLSYLAPDEAPVDIEIIPSEPPQFTFTDSSSGSGAQVELHWSGVRIDLYPWIDVHPERALGFTFDVSAGISLMATPDGSASLVIEQLALDNFVETFNETGMTATVGSLGGLLELFLPALLGQAVDVPLAGSTLGMPLAVKLRAIARLGAEGRHLGVFLRLCGIDDLTDAADTVCYDPNATSGRDAPAAFAVQAVGVGHVPAGGVLRVRAFSDIAPGELELAVRAEGLGPYFGFTAAESDGTFALRHPLLAWPGEHLFELIGRDRARPGRLTTVGQVTAVVDGRAPWLALRRDAAGVTIEAHDDRSPSAAIDVRVRLGERELEFAPRTFVAAAPELEVLVWARDEAGLVSAPVRSAAFLPPAALPTIEEAPAGCSSARTEGALLVVLLGAAYLARSRPRRRS